MKIFFHSSDLDGHASGAIVKFKYPGAELIGINYGQQFPFDKLNKDEIVFMVDFSLPIIEMLKLSSIVGGEKLIWIDHHKSAIDESNKRMLSCNPEFTISFNQMCPGRREIGKGACELTWEYLFPDSEIPEAVRLLGRYDVWDLQKNVLEFQYGFRLNNTYPINQNFWSQYFDPETSNDHIEEIINDGKLVLKYQKQENYKYITSTAFETEIQNLKAIVSNKLLTSSQLFESIWDENKYDLMITFGRRKDKTWTVSFYSTKSEIDCSEIARHCLNSTTAGGHKGAAGATFKNFEDLPFN